MTDQTHCNSCRKKLSDNDLDSEGYGPRNILLCARCRKLSAAQHRHWAPVMQWEHDCEGLRLASTAPIPWRNPNVVMLCISRGGKIVATHTLTGKRRMLQDDVPKDMLLVAWPGNRRQDIFVVDNRKAALGALA